MTPKKAPLPMIFSKEISGVSIWKVGPVTDSPQSDICCKVLYAPRATCIVRVDRLNDLVDVDGKVGPPGDINDLDVVKLPKESGRGAVTLGKAQHGFVELRFASLTNREASSRESRP